LVTGDWNFRFWSWRLGGNYCFTRPTEAEDVLTKATRSEIGRAPLSAGIEYLYAELGNLIGFGFKKCSVEDGVGEPRGQNHINQSVYKPKTRNVDERKSINANSSGRDFIDQLKYQTYQRIGGHINVYYVLY